MRKKTKLHFLLIYPLHTAPSQRFRFEQYFAGFELSGYNYSTNSFYDSKTYLNLYSGKNKPIQALRILFCFIRRCFHLFTLLSKDIVLIQRGAAPVGPPFFEWIIKFILRKKIIYDFDDAIWMSPQKKINPILSFLKSYNKVSKICKWADIVVVGNSYLLDYAKQFSRTVTLIPTVVDTENKFFPLPYTSGPIPIIGWTGSHTTLPYLEALEEVLFRVNSYHPFEMVIMANKPPKFKKLPYRFIQWSESLEAKALSEISIGIMPLPNDEWTKGKCGFKAIQYMALEKPAVVSAIGFNNELITNGVDGYLCNTDQDWEKNLLDLLSNPQKIESFGLNARKKIEKKYSLNAATQLWIDLLNKV